MQTKNATGNLVNRYKAVLKKCNLINVFGTLAMASALMVSPALLNNAFAATNPNGTAVDSMQASDKDPTLENYGTISGGKDYTEGNTKWAAMYGYTYAATNYNFTNFGNITINKPGVFNVYGMYADADGDGSHRLSNSGTITVSGNGDIHGMYAVSNNAGSHRLSNSGTMTVSGSSFNVYGMRANAEGSHTLFNSGTMTVSGVSTMYGMHAYTASGSHTLTNSGTMTVSGTDVIYGMYAENGNTSTDSHTLTNSGTIRVSGTSTIHGMYAISGAVGGSHTLTNSGTMTVSGSSYNVYGMRANANGDHSLTNSGTMTVSSTGDNVFGMSANATTGSHTLTNSGTMTVSSTHYEIFGMYASATTGSHKLTNSGTITLSGTIGVYGMRADATTGNHSLTNSGVITVSGDSSIFGMHLWQGGSHTVSNTGYITATATGGSAREVYGNNCSYSVNTWATTLRTWSNNDAVFGAADTQTVSFNNSTLILRPGTAAQGFVLGKEYNVGNQTGGMSAGFNGTIDGTIGAAVTEVPFLKATLSNGTNAANATVSLSMDTDGLPNNATTAQASTVVEGQMTNISTQLRNTLANVYLNANYAPALSASLDDTAVAQGMVYDWTFFGNLYGSYTDNSKYNYDAGAFGITTGASHLFNEKLTAGFHLDFNVTDSDAGNMDNYLKSFAFGGHANYFINDNVYVGANATYALGENDTKYKAGIDMAQDTHTSHSLFTGANAGYVFAINDSHVIIPELGLAYLYSYANEYSLNFANLSGYNMTVHGNAHSSLFADVNLKWQGKIALENGTLTPSASVGYRHKLVGADIDSSVDMFGSRFNTTTTSDTSSLLANAGISYTGTQFTIGANYSGEFGSDQTSHMGSLDLMYRF